LCPGFDNRFDDFWSELKQQNDNILLACRSRETLAWHFRSPLMRTTCADCETGWPEHDTELRFGPAE